MANLEKLVEELSALTVLEAAQLSKLLEDKWGVSAAAAPAAEVKDDFTVMLTAAGDKKINVIKEVRALTSLGLKEAKDLVEAAPKTILESVDKAAADKAKEALEAAGATVTVK